MWTPLAWGDHFRATWVAGLLSDHLGWGTTFGQLGVAHYLAHYLGNYLAHYLGNHLGNHLETT